MKNLLRKKKEYFKDIERINRDMFYLMFERRDIQEMKTVIFKERLSESIQVDILKDEIKKDLKGLREDLWYQRDRMKFVNLTDSKFKQFESKFNAHVSERIKSDEDEMETTASDGKSDEKPEKFDMVSEENEKDSEHEFFDALVENLREKSENEVVNSIYHDDSEYI